MARKGVSGVEREFLRHRGAFMDRSMGQEKLLVYYLVGLSIFLTLACAGSHWIEKRKEAERNVVVIPAHCIPNTAYVGLPRMSVSLGQGDSMNLELEISMEVDSKDAEILEGYVPQIVDRLNLFFPRIRIKEAAQPNAMYFLRKDMLWQINSIPMPIKVRDIVFEKLVIM